MVVCVKPEPSETVVTDGEVHRLHTGGEFRMGSFVPTFIVFSTPMRDDGRTYPLAQSRVQIVEDQSLWVNPATAGRLF
jgi:hypothetical protein